MLIREMSREECFRMLAGARVARLACARENRPYVVPVYYAYDEVLGALYGLTFPGRKVEWMRANPRVCVQVDEIVTGNQWKSIIGNGRYEELPQSAASGAPRLPFQDRPPPTDSRDGPWDDDDSGDELERAWKLLKTIHPVWFEPRCTAWAARVNRDAKEPVLPIYFRIRLDDITGRQATPDAGDAIAHAQAATVAGRLNLLRGRLERLFGGK